MTQEKQYLVTTTATDGKKTDSLVKSPSDLATVTGEQHAVFGVNAVDADGKVTDADADAGITSITVSEVEDVTHHDRKLKTDD